MGKSKEVNQFQRVCFFQDPLGNPPLGWVKWNVDASWNNNFEKAAVGGVLRDWNKNFRCIFSLPVKAKEINEAEVWAIYKAVVLTEEKEWVSYLNVIIESDSSNAVEWCNADSGGPWNVCFVLNKIRVFRRRNQL